MFTQEVKARTAPRRLIIFGGVNMTLRGLTLASKFLLVISLSRALSAAEIGLYGLFVATINYCMYLIGLEFHTYATRELLSRPRFEWARMIRDQVCFYGLSYLVLVPGLLLVFGAGVLPWNLVGWFYLLIILEHFCQEGYRLLLALERPFVGGLVLFFRLGAWAYAVAGIFWFFPDKADLGLVWLGWALGGGLALILVLAGLSSLDWTDIKKHPIDWAWIKIGMKKAMPFILIALVSRAMFTADRYVLDFFEGRETVGVYTLFMGMAISLQSFIDSGVVAIYYPKIIRSVRLGNKDEAEIYTRNMARAIAGLIVLGLIIAGFLIRPVLAFIGKSIYIDHVSVFWVLLSSISLTCLSFVFHYKIFAMGLDRALVIISIAAFVIFVAVCLVLTPLYGIMGVCISHLVSQFVLLGMKYKVAKGVKYG
jgi:O-antigen/teichoic acid export membrane protein